MIELPVLQCKRCDYKWYPRNPRPPAECPRCKNHYWNCDRINVIKLQPDFNEDSIQQKFRIKYPDCYFIIQRYFRKYRIRVKDLKDMSDNDLLRIENFGKKRLEQFREFFPL